MIKQYFFIFCFLLLFPLGFAFGAEPGDVVINEVMWVGEEWIELYNLTDKEIDISGWVIQNAKTSGGSLEIPATKKIFPQAYFLICDEDKVGDKDCDLPKAGLSLTDNEGNGDLILIAKIGSEGKEIDRAKGDKWPAGKKVGTGANTKYYSMERVNPKVLGSEECNWKTAQETISWKVEEKTYFGTPKEKNSQYLEEDCRIFFANAGENIISLTNIEITFDASNSKGNIEKYIWNLGDGSEKEGKVVSHQYKVSGKYIVSLTVISGSKQDIDTIEVEIYPKDIFISEFSLKEKWVEVVNDSDFIENISGFEIATKNEKGSGFVFPENSLIDEKSFLLIPANILSKLSFEKDGSLFLFWPSGDIKQEIKYGKIEEGSIARRGDEYFYTKTPTPGMPNVISNIQGESSSTSEQVSTKEGSGSSQVLGIEKKEAKLPPQPRKILGENIFAQAKKQKTILALTGFGVLIFSGIYGFGLVKLKRRIKNRVRANKRKEVIELEIEE